MQNKNRIIEVFALPELVPTDHQCDVCFAIDVLRATTTITTALQNGAKEVHPFLTVEETFQAKQEWLRQKSKRILLLKNENVAHFESKETIDSAKIAETLILGGERQGLPIQGFDAGNSPDSYSPEFVRNRTLFFSTTNGTKAILRALETVQASSGESDENPKMGAVFLASFLNAQAVVDLTERYFQKRNLDFKESHSSLFSQNERISIVCAGTNGQYTEEDLLLAGCLVERLSSFELSQENEFRFSLNVQAENVRAFWQNAIKETQLTRMNSKQTGQLFSNDLIETIYSRLLKSRGGQNLRKIHLEKDILFAAQLDSLSIVPYLKNNVILSQSTT